MSPPPQQEDMSEPPVAAVGLLSYETLVHAVAGAVGSATAMSVFFPLDTARIRLQVDEHRKSRSTPVILAEIAKEEGVAALYRGWFPVISSLCCSNFVYFYTFNTLKALWVLERGRSRPGRDLLMGFISGAVNVLLTTPMWVVNTRLKLQGARFRNEELQQTHYKGIFDAFSQIVAREGLGSLWNGTLPSLLLVFNPAVQFMFYEAMKRRAGRGRRKISSLEIFLMGALAKAVATTATYPLQTVQAVLRFGQYKSEAGKSLLGSIQNVVHLLMERISKQGVAGLYKGLEAKLLQTVLTAALMFVVYEKITAVTFKVMGLSRKVRR
ncbi:PM34 protein, partial [Atractosteus spatula]|nr:PM34 protein [Atractosteus spatula]